MGQAKIISGGPTGLYNIALQFDIAKVVTRLAAISKRLIALGPLITAATTAVDAAVIALNSAMETLERAISNERIPIPSLIAVARWDNAGNGKCESVSPGPDCKVGRYTLLYGAFISGDPFTSPPIPDSTGFSVSNSPGDSLPVAAIGSYTSSEINFTTSSGSTPFESGDGFDIDVTEETREPVTPVTVAMKAVIEAQATLQRIRRDQAALKLELIALEKEKTSLDSVSPTENLDNVWCADLTENMPAGKDVGTIEVNGEAKTILIMPAGAAGLGKLQPTQASCPSGVFYNLALQACWQKWKPTYRVGVIKTISYILNTCSVCVDAVFSSVQGLAINQAGVDCSQALANIYSGFAAFAAANPNHPMITNTGDAVITMSEQLTKDLDEVNRSVNTTHPYKQDADKLDKWNFLSPGAPADCEDMALQKLQMLLDKGYPIGALKFEAGETTKGTGHGWLTVITSEGEKCLDINYQNVMPAEGLNYTNRRRLTGTQWKRSGVLLSNVPVEYMNGDNASVFEVGDRVIVAFTSQDWNTPKVIGFESNPKTGALIYRMQNGVFSTYNLSSGALLSSSLGVTLPIQLGYLAPSVIKGQILYTLHTSTAAPGDGPKDIFKINIRNKRTGVTGAPITATGAVMTASGNSATTFKTNLPSAVNDFYKGAFLIITSAGALLGQERSISGFIGATKTVVLASALTGIPAAGVTFRLAGSGGFSMPAICPDLTVYGYVNWCRLGGIYVDSADRIWVSITFRTSYSYEQAGVWCYSSAGTFLGSSTGYGTTALLWNFPGQIAMYQATSGWQVYACDEGNERLKQWPYTNINSVTLYGAAAFALTLAGNKLYALVWGTASGTVRPVSLYEYNIAPATGNLTFVKSTLIVNDGGDPVNGNSMFHSLQAVQGGLYVSRTSGGHYMVYRYSISGTLEKSVDIGIQILPQYDVINVFVG